MRNIVITMLFALNPIFLCFTKQSPSLEENSDINPVSDSKSKHGSNNADENANLLFENRIMLEKQGDFSGYNFFAGDLTGDGKADLIAVSPENGRSVIWKNMGITFSSAVVWMEKQGNYSGYNFMVADMTGDNKADLIAVSPVNGRAVLWESTGNKFSTAVTWMENQGNYSKYNFLVGDMTGDGKADLIAVSPSNGEVLIWKSTGSNFGSAKTWIENQGNYSEYNFLVGDMTGDGKADLIAVSPSKGRAIIWKSSGSTFGRAKAWLENQGNYSGYNFIVGDMTGDKKADLIAITAQSGRAVVWESTGSTFSSAVAWMENQGDFSGNTFCIAEFNGIDFSGKRKCDLVAINNSNVQTMLWSLNHYIWKTGDPTIIPSELRRISGKKWNNDDAYLPYLVYIPEKNKLIMELQTFPAKFPKNNRSVLIKSYDQGVSWTNREDFSNMGLTNAGNGVLFSFHGELNHEFLKSTNYGDKWEKTGNSITGIIKIYTWDPFLVINKSKGNRQLVQIGYKGNGIVGTKEYFSQPYIRFSSNDAHTWSSPQEIKNLKGVCEVNLLATSNGDWIAACRTDPNPKFFGKANEDNYGGLAISISHNQGKDWSDITTLFDFGRHHPSMVLLNDNHTILMTYAVRVGGCRGVKDDDFLDSKDGYPFFGIEAIISNDNGKTWDVDHRYILSRWKGNIPTIEKNYFFRFSQSTSTVQLPDSSLLTAYGTGRYGTSNSEWFMDIDLIRWKK